ncbi:PREDICTED: ras-associated and pleckstrin homology domains-containing protein 1-like isoform X2 [Nicrophorus vespilloides]|uniref:Ras-associated and pleckstrin homology domains-containing protein 1-like isoform X2 n=1 Tax=Nicrophorus vespilloides TaxID=110193 RepID=A0ABM1NF15_NICVS|nr:PREDICTED: ras-associated and pleckstrin homology domains-containing protein 1-like isoform X2 [Nicrophorus vespilloides]
MFCGGSFRARIVDENDHYRVVNVHNRQVKLPARRQDDIPGDTASSAGTGGRDFLQKRFSLDTDRRTGHQSKSRTGLDASSSSNQLLRANVAEIGAPRIDSYRFSMANLEDSPEVDLDAILGELCALETQVDKEIGDVKRQSDSQKLSQHLSRTHTRSSSEGPRMNPADEALMMKADSDRRTDSPDNDSAFSDTVSMLSSESSASSGGSGSKPQSLQLPKLPIQDEATKVKAEKIRMAMEKIKEANIQKLFVKVFTVDGSAKSLLVDEKMTCDHVTRLLADKNHVQMDPKWALVEHIPDLYMERTYEDHELLVENLLLWTRESKNKIYFVERPEKTVLFMQPERFLLGSGDKRQIVEYDEHQRSLLLEDFFASGRSTAFHIPEIEGPLYLKSESKKGWKKYYFVLRASGLYYVHKEKLKNTKDLVCLATFDMNQMYYGLGWKKKYKAPTDFCFAIKHPRLQEPKSTKFIKYLCAEDQQTLEKWMVGIRIAKYGKQLMDNYRCLMDELAQEDLDLLAHARSCSVSSIAVPSLVTTPTQSYSASDGYGTQSETYSSAPSEISSGRLSRASSSSSSGCMSDGAPSSCENAFDSEFPMGTIKRKPSMKPSLPLTSITRQLKEVGETRDEVDATLPTSPVSYTNTGTLTRRHSRRKSNSDDSGSNSGTLKRQHSYKSRGSIESMGNRSGNTTPLCGNSSPLCGTPVRERASPFGERSDSFSPDSAHPPIRSPTSIVDMPSMTDSIISLPPPPEETGEISADCQSLQLPPPPPDLYNSNQSLDSLPPPPSDLPPLSENELTGSQLSLMSLPPLPSDDTGTIRRRKDSSATATPTNVLSPERTPTMSPTPTCDSESSTPTQGKVFDLSTEDHYKSLPNSGSLRSSMRHSATNYYSDSLPLRETSPKKNKKKISFNLGGFQEVTTTSPPVAPILPKKPPPPKRSESTRLSSPKKLQDPPTDFLKDLQRVMRKKWQVAQKCKEEPATTPHEVLGFRDPPAVLPDYKETNVSNWVQEHYGANNFYENVYRVFEVAEYSCSPVHVRNSADMSRGRRPPPPPPKRSETTHLSSVKMH